jgi:putative membrane protein
MNLYCNLRRVVTFVLLFCGPFASAHETAERVVRGSEWKFWTFDPFVIAPILACTFLYVCGLRNLRRRSSLAVTWWQVVSFSCGMLSLAVALVSPLHALGSVLFSAHMTQHEVLMLLAAPLIVMGRPLIVFLWALPETWRKTLGDASKVPWFARSWRFLTLPVVVWLVHGITLWVWHLPYLYQATLSSDLVHGLQHSFFLFTALLFWWTLIHGRFGHSGYGAAVLYIYTTAVHSSVLGALLTFAQNVWYPVYDGRTTTWGLTALEDQQLGGLIMWVPSGAVFVVIGLALFAAWLGESEKRALLARTDSMVRAGGRP